MGIVAINFILKVMLIEMVSGLRLKTMTLETDITMQAIFRRSVREYCDTPRAQQR